MFPQTRPKRRPSSFPLRWGRPSRASGSALILVLWTVGSLGLFAAALGARSVQGLNQVRRMERRLQARYIALVGVQHALRILEEDQTPSFDGLGEPWRGSEAIFRQQPFGTGSFTLSYSGQDPSTGQPQPVYGFLDEESKIPLNTAPSELLDGLLRQAEGLKESDRQEIVDSILDWRDEDRDKSPYGAESFYYLGLDPAYECKDGPFESVEELLLVRGVTPELFDWMAPHVAVHGAGRVNLNTAGQVVLKALGLSDAGVTGLVFYRAGEDNLEGTEDDRTFGSVSAALAELGSLLAAEEVNRLAQLAQENALTAGSEAFALSIQAESEGDLPSRMEIYCVMDRKGRIRAWSER